MHVNVDRVGVRYLSVLSKRWTLLTATVLVQLALGAVYVWSLFGSALGPTSQSELHLTTTQATMPFEAALGMIFVGAFIGGKIQDRRGPRVVALSGGSLYAIGVISASAARSPGQFWILLLGYGIVGGLGVGLAYIVPTAMLQKWFPDKRALATGIAVGGFGLGGVLTALVAEPILARNTLEPASAFLPLGILYLLMVWLGGIFFRNPPGTAAQPSIDEQPSHLPVSATLSEALRDHRWYLLTLILTANVTVSVAFIGTASGAGNSIAGLTQGQDGILVSIIAVANGAGRVLWATISERIGRMLVFTVMLVIQSACLFVAPHAHAATLFYLIAVLIGLCCGGGFGVMPATAGDYFGLRHSGAIYGLMLVGWSIGGIVGPFCVSAFIAASTRAGKPPYNAAYAILGTVACAAIVLPLVTRPRAGQGFFRGLLAHAERSSGPRLISAPLRPLVTLNDSRSA